MLPVRLLIPFCTVYHTAAAAEAVVVVVAAAVDSSIAAVLVFLSFFIFCVCWIAHFKKVFQFGVTQKYLAHFRVAPASARWELRPCGRTPCWPPPRPLWHPAASRSPHAGLGNCRQSGCLESLR